MTKAIWPRVLMRTVGVVTSAVAAVVVVTLGVLMADRVPFSSYNVTDADRFFGLVFAAWALALAGLVWLIAVLVVWRKRHLRTRWLAVPPVLVVLGAAAVVAIGVIAPAGFDSSRPDLDAVAAEVRSHPTGWSEHYGYESPRRAGHLDVGSVFHREDGVVVISDADAGVFFHVSGWAHSPQGPPDFDPGVRGLEVEHLGGPWYSYSYVL